MENTSGDAKTKIPTSIDWFSTIDRATPRLYNPRFRTSLSQEAWQVTPQFLAENAEVLKLMMGSKDVTVHLHGSAGLGLAGKGVKGDGIWDISPSDLDLFILVGEKDEYEERFQATYSDSLNSRFPHRPDLREDERMWEFYRQVGKFNLGQGQTGELHPGMRLDSVFVSVPRILDGVKNISEKISSQQKLNSDDFYTLYNTVSILGSAPIFQTREGLDTQFRNSILATILNVSEGKRIWKWLGDFFQKYLVEYEENPIKPFEHAKIAHKKRVAAAFKEILETEGVHEEKHGRISEFMRKRRKSLQFPSYEELETIKDRVLLATTSQ